MNRQLELKMTTIDSCIDSVEYSSKPAEKTCQKSKTIFSKSIDTMTQMSPLHAIVIFLCVRLVSAGSASLQQNRLLRVQFNLRAKIRDEFLNLGVS
jgi:hypothetical protein